MAADERPLFDELLDVALYAPVGLAVRALEQVPGLAAAGKARIGSQVTQARVLGRFAVTMAKTKASRSFERPRSEPATPPAERDGGGPEAATPPEPAPAEPAAPAEPESTTAGRHPHPPQGIPDYDALSASQVVPRLSGLTDDELAAVKAYEAATRRRRTILGRIAQLEQERDGGH